MKFLTWLVTAPAWVPLTFFFVLLPGVIAAPILIFLPWS